MRKKLGLLGYLGRLGKLGLLGNLGRLVRLEMLVMLVLLASCGSATKEELASLAAKGYYDHLIHGEYEQFYEGLDHRTLSDGTTLSTDSAYRSQMLDNLRQFMAHQEQAHRGVLEVRVSNATTDTVQQLTNVFLVLCVADSTNEEIVVPRVERHGAGRKR